MVGVVLGGLFGVAAYYFDLQRSLFSLGEDITGSSFSGCIAVGVTAGLVIGSLGGVVVALLQITRCPK